MSDTPKVGRIVFGSATQPAIPTFPVKPSNDARLLEYKLRRYEETETLNEEATLP
jgi:hypothetical protein